MHSEYHACVYTVVCHHLKRKLICTVCGWHFCQPSPALLPFIFIGNPDEQCRGLIGLSEQMLKMSGLGGLNLGPIHWRTKSNGKSVPPVETPLPLQQVCYCTLKTAPCQSFGQLVQTVTGPAVTSTFDCDLRILPITIIDKEYQQICICTWAACWHTSVHPDSCYSCVQSLLQTICSSPSAQL